MELFNDIQTYSPEDAIISIENVKMINDLVDTLPDKCKMAFKLVREDKMSYREAAEVMEISVGTLNYHIYMAIKKIKTQLTK